MLTEAQIQSRKNGIGGSDVAAILGQSRFKTPLDVYLSKVGESAPEEQSQAAYWGSILEEPVAKEYAKRKGVKIQRVNAQLRHNSYEWAIANIDRAVINPEISGNVRIKDSKLTTDKILEVKTANGFLTKLWGDPGSDYIPDAYLYQVQWYMFVAGCNLCDVAVLIGGQDFRIYTVKYDEEIIFNILPSLKRFWECVQTKTPPAPSTAAEAAKLYPLSQKGKSVIVDVEVAKACDRLREIKDAQAALKGEEDALKAKVMQSFADAEEITHGGVKLATWKTQSRTSIDAKALRDEQPDLYKLYARESASRVFRLV